MRVSKGVLIKSVSTVSMHTHTEVTKSRVHHFRISLFAITIVIFGILKYWMTWNTMAFQNF